jgi:hypothetical protein
MEHIKLAPPRRRPRRIAKKVALRLGAKHERDWIALYIRAAVSPPRIDKEQAANRFREHLARLSGDAYTMSEGVPWTEYVGSPVRYYLDWLGRPQSIPGTGIDPNWRITVKVVHED